MSSRVYPSLSGVSGFLPPDSLGYLKVAQISCGTEWSGVQHEIEKAAKSVGVEVFFPEATIDDIVAAENIFNFKPASHNLRVELGQAVRLVQKKIVVDGVIVLNCFRCAEGSIVKSLVRTYLQRNVNAPVVTYSFTESTKAGNLLLRMEALANIIRRRVLLRLREHKGTTLGIDSGSTMTKAIIVEDGEIVDSYLTPTTEVIDSGMKAFEKILAKASLSPEKIDAIGVTGYGRTILGEKLKANLIQDEITVCAKGATFLAKKTEGYTTIVDIGGGDNKAVTTYDGVPDSFTVGGVCAGASGRFLEVAANRLGVNIEKFGELAIQGDPSKVPMNAYCIVFGMQDIVTSMAEGAHKEDVAAAACHSVAEQFFEQQMQDIEVREPIIQVGTTSLNIGLVRAMESVTKRKILVPKYSPYAGAIGAALLASGVKFFE